VLTGSGRGFCAGQDLADLDFTPGQATDLGELINAWFNPLVRRLQALPLPVIAAVNGTAAGAGRTWPSPATSCSRPGRPASSRPS
jgi:2-(1,2-epoxy-1,2-dihydrophenyl)acetyl-CoA isomerase